MERPVTVRLNDVPPGAGRIMRRGRSRPTDIPVKIAHDDVIGDVVLIGYDRLQTDWMGEALN